NPAISSVVQVIITSPSIVQASRPQLAAHSTSPKKNILGLFPFSRHFSNSAKEGQPISPLKHT
ncbi:MAG: hypothetical protein VX809_05450, partial [Pseudomonadota bacterium]|nr:hypothetical protein [Pseudomonadota bacterium]